MPSSSIFSSRRVSWAGLIAVSLVLGAEIVARMLVPSSARARGFPTEAIARKTAQLDEIRRNGGRVDVLFVGSSPVHFGISPEAFERAASDTAPVKAYNAGVNGPHFVGIRAVVDKFYLTKADPRVIYIGLVPNDVNSGSMALRRATKELLGLVDQSVPRFLYGLRIFDQRKRLAGFLRTLDKRRLTWSECTDLARGHERFTVRRGWGAAERLGDLQVKGPAADSLEAFMREQGFRGRICVVVNMPMRNDWRKHISPKQYDAYLGMLTSAARRNRARLLDLMDSGVVNQSSSPSSGCDFGDMVHLKPEGATKLATRLGAYHRQQFGAVDRIAERP